MKDNPNTRHYECPNCGRVFYLPVGMSPTKYAYQVSVKDERGKHSKRKCCGYSCFREWEASHK